MNHFSSIVSCACFAFCSATVFAAPVGFEETFALAADRATVLEQLVPGTEDYYFYHGLHYQQAGQIVLFEANMQAWAKRIKHSGRRDELRYRQDLLRFAADPNKAFELIRQQDRLQFTHSRRGERRPNTYPTVLKQELIDADRLLQEALRRNKDLRHVTDEGLVQLDVSKLDEGQRRRFLQRQKGPWHPQLIELIAADLAAKNSGGYGSLPIHSQLTLAQLDALAVRRSGLKRDANWVQQRLARMAPGEGTDWVRNPAAEAAHLDTVWAWVATLDPAFNSLKTQTLFRRVELDLRLNTLDQDRLMTYLKLPRPVGYIHRDYLRAKQFNGVHADLRKTYRPCLPYPPVGNDERVIRELTGMALLADPKFKDAVAPYIDKSYLERLEAEVMILAGRGNVETWASRLSPTAFQALRDRVDIRFAPGTPLYVAADAAVTLPLQLKNVEQLLVKTFEINTFNYYRDTGSEVGGNINLDGLIAASVEQVDLDVSPLRRVERQLPLPGCEKPGVYVVELIGNGTSSRAIIRKGHLRAVSRPTAVGTLCRVFDETGKPAPTASLWLGEREFSPDDKGRIVIPFSESGGTRSGVIRDGDFASLTKVHLAQESYRLVGDFTVVQERLLPGSEAEVLVRASLMLGNRPTSLRRGSDVRLTITATDHEGVATEHEIRGLELKDGADLSVPFRVPENVRTLQFVLRAEVKRLDGQEPTSLQAADAVEVNGEASSTRVARLFVRRDGPQWILEALGRNGEPVAHRPVNVSVLHRYSTEPARQTLQTDAQGRVALGVLPLIRQVTATSDGFQQAQFGLGDQMVTWPAAIQSKQGEVVTLAHASGERYHLVERVGGVNVVIWDVKLAVDAHTVTLTGLDEGTYILQALPSEKQIAIRVVDGVEVGPYLVDGGRVVQRQQGLPVRLTVGEITDKEVSLKIEGGDAATRVHVTALAFAGPWLNPFGGSDPLPAAGVWPGGAQGSAYQVGRRLGDEVRYVLERRLLTPYPGNMLRRPELILNPWVQQETTAQDQVAREGRDFSGGFGGRAAGGMVADMMARQGKASASMDGGGRGWVSPDLRWMGNQAPLWLNQVPGDDGVLRIPRDQLAGRNILHVLVAHPRGILRQRVVLPLDALTRTDRRLAPVLDPKARHAEVDRVRVLQAGKPQEIALEGTRFEPVGDVAGLFQVYKTMLSDGRFDDFSFLTRWHTLGAAERAEKFEEHTSHELNFFLFHKDRVFFEMVVKPYLANKLQKDFMDRYLLGEDLSDALAPAAFGKLHPAEQVLLALRAGKAGEAVRTSLEQGAGLWKPDRAVMRSRFDLVLQRSGLDRDGDALDDAIAVTAPAESPAPVARVASLGALRKMDSRRTDMKKEMASNMMLSGSVERLQEKGKARARASLSVVDIEEAELLEEVMDMDADGFADLGAAFGGEERRLYRPLERTKEWAEMFYYKRGYEEDRKRMSQLTAFWAAVLASGKEGPLLTDRMLDPVHSFSEAMFALALIDLPFEEGALDISRNDKGTITLKASKPVLLFQRSVEQVGEAEEPALLVAQRYVDPSDRTRRIDGEERPVFVTGAFVKGRVYGGQVVLSNPNPQRVELDVLIQIPGGSLPVGNGFRTKSRPLTLQGYSTEQMEYFFYFPTEATFAGCPVQLGLAGQVVARAEARSFEVLAEPRPEMGSKWVQVARHGSSEEVLQALGEENLWRIDLSEMYYRLKDEAFYEAASDLFSSRAMVDRTTYSYAVHHKDMARVGRYLPLSSLAHKVGPVFTSKMLTVDPFTERKYQHLEYHPLVNPRAHQLGARREIPNQRIHEVYTGLMRQLSYRAKLTPDHRLMVTYYLLLQDRLDEGLAWFDLLERKTLHSQVQYDYLAAYVSFYRDGGKAASQLAKQYADYPVPKWQKRFAEVANQLAQISGGEDEVQEGTDRDQQLDAQATVEGFVELKVEGDQINIAVGQATSVTLRFYPMDVELLFSQQPFMEHDAARFRYIRAAKVVTVKVPKGDNEVVAEMPAEYRRSNLHIEAEAGGALDQMTHLSSDLRVRVLEQAGHVDVRRASGKRAPVAAAYVKVYARKHDGSVRFWKDGYTDLRGRFDFVSRNDLPPSEVERFSILVVHPEHGAVLEEGGVPVQ